VQLGDGAVTIRDPLPVGKSITSFTCPSQCFASEKHVFAIGYHQHATGIAMLNEHTDNSGNDKTDAVFAAAEYYDWELQRTLETNFTISSGDSIKTTCIYDTGNSENVKFGLGSEDEMCIMFLYYYPAQPGFEYCGAAPKFGNSTFGCDGDVTPIASIDDSFIFRTFPIAAVESPSIPPSLSKSPDSASMSTGVIVGIVIACIAGLAVLGAVISTLFSAFAHPAKRAPVEADNDVNEANIAEMQNTKPQNVVTLA